MMSTRERQGRKVLFSRGEGAQTHTHIHIHVGAANTRRIRQRQYVLGRSPCQRHCRSPMDGGEAREKKRKRGNAKKFV